MNAEEMAVELSQHSMKLNELERRVQNIETDNKQIQDLTLNLNNLANIVSNIVNIQEKQKEEIDAIRQEPAENWKHLKNTIITAIITAVVSGGISAIITFLATKGV